METRITRKHADFREFFKQKRMTQISIILFGILSFWATTRVAPTLFLFHQPNNLCGVININSDEIHAVGCIA